MSTSRCETFDQSICQAMSQSGATTRREGLGGKLLRAVTRVADAILLWQERATQRAHLATLDDHMLRDLGLSRADVEREAAVPFWRAR